MANIKLVEFVQCPKCRQKYEVEAEAAACCFDGEKVKRWQCQSCREFFEDPETASRCCD